MPPPFASCCCANASALHWKRMREKHKAVRGSDGTLPPRMPLPTCTRRNLASTMLFPRPISEQGYATEAAQALINYAFTQLHLKRIVATTTYENEASIGVMRKVGMRIEKNPSPDPSGFQAVGILGNSLTHGLPTGT